MARRGGTGVSMYVTGLESITKNMEAKSQESSVAVEKAMVRLALLVERIAKDEYVPVISGRLKASIGGQMAPPPQEPGDAVFHKVVTGSAVDVWTGTNVVYAPSVEFGHKGGGRIRRHGPAVPRGLFAPKAKVKAVGNGKHGPFLRPAMAKAMAVGEPVVAAEVKAAMGLKK